MSDGHIKDARYFVVLNGPNYPRVIMEDEDRMALYTSPEAAREALKQHGAVRAFGAQIFELGDTDEEIL